MVCVITGASSGIGLALARELAARGARLSLAARRGDKLVALKDELGGDHLTIPTDVADVHACERLIRQTADRFGRIDTLIANAGYGLSKPVVETTRAEIEQIFAVNLFGTHDCIRFAVPIMRGQPPRDGCRGQIMITSSTTARRGVPFSGAYNATKAGQLSLAEALRIELANENIAVTSVHPTGTRTEFFDTAEARGSVRVQGIGARRRQQTSLHVARRMVRAIKRPVREVWPARTVRYLLGVTAVFPGMGDLVMNKMRRDIENA